MRPLDGLAFLISPISANWPAATLACSAAANGEGRRLEHDVGHERGLGDLLRGHGGRMDEVADVDDVALQQLVEGQAGVVVAHGRGDRPRLHLPEAMRNETVLTQLDVDGG